MPQHVRTVQAVKALLKDTYATKIRMGESIIKPFSV